jgi:outer membrane protein TolC
LPKTHVRRHRLSALGCAQETQRSSGFFGNGRQMTTKETMALAGDGRPRLAAVLALLVVVCAGMENRPALAQDPGAGGRAAASNTGRKPASGVAPGENPEVISAPMPSVLPQPQERPAPAENQDSISFSWSLALVSGQNPQIAFANEQINEAFAQLKDARVLWLPSIRAGLSYNHHDGPIQANDGTITQSSRSALEAGLGTMVVGGGSPVIPGVTANFRLTDAVFQPRIAGEHAAARQHAATATTHDFLLFVAVAYLDLLRAFQQQAIAQETLSHAEQLGKLTAAFAQTGQGSQADADRAQTELAVRTNVVAQATVQTRVASARLVELLDLQSSRILVPQEPALVPIELVSHETAATQLVAEGLSNRPELAASHHLVAQAVDRLDRERYAPLVPSVILGISQGGYGGGPGSTLSDFRGRFDLDATAYWELRNFGAGEVAAREAARSRLDQTKLLQIQLLDRVAREIVEAHAQSESLRGQITVAQSGIRVASESYRRNLERIRGGQGLPLEVLQSIQALDQSRREYLRAVGDYDEWQFRLYRAMGYPIPPEKSPTK